MDIHDKMRQKKIMPNILTLYSMQNFNGKSILREEEVNLRQFYWLFEETDFEVCVAFSYAVFGCIEHSNNELYIKLA